MLFTESLKRIAPGNSYSLYEITSRGLLWGARGVPIINTSWVRKVLHQNGFKPKYNRKAKSYQYHVLGADLIKLNQKIYAKRNNGTRDKKGN